MSKGVAAAARKGMAVGVNLLLLFLILASRGKAEVVPSPPVRAIGSFPAVKNSTVLFLHVFKCGGTSLREVFMSLAEDRGWSGARVVGCKRQAEVQFYDPPGGYICISHVNEIIDSDRGKWLVAGTKVLAGHFLWDFRKYVTQPYLLITMLRNPLERFVSGVQFKHQGQTSTLEEAAELVASAMRHPNLTWSTNTQLGLARNFLDNAAVRAIAAASDADGESGPTNDELKTMAETAISHLRTFFVVGVVEQYAGFVNVLGATLNSGVEHHSLWTETSVGIRNNASPIESANVLGSIDPDLVRSFNASVLIHQWKVYEAALEMWDARCREVLPLPDHGRLCSVPGYS